jgi:hypothetical protein
LDERDSPSFVGISFSGVGGPANAPRSICDVLFFVSFVPKRFFDGMNQSSAKEKLIGADARWLRLELRGVTPIDEVHDVTLSELGDLAPSLGYPLAEPLLMGKHIKIPAGGSTISFLPANKCIYCGTTEYEPNSARPLGDEHIIPGGLGAALVLPHASCKAHERVTSGIEAKLFQQLFDPVRKHMSMRSPRIKPMLKANFEVSHTVDGKEVKLRLPIGQHPTLLFLSRLGPAGILTGRPQTLHGIVGAWMINVNVTAENLKRHGMTAVNSPSLDTLLFTKLLAKIGVAFATAEFGPDFFVPLATDFVIAKFEKLGNDNRRYHIVGGDPKPSDPSPFLHELSLGAHYVNGIIYIVVTIRLFAFLAAPTYHVVVGTVPISKRADLISVLSANNFRMQNR